MLNQYGKHHTGGRMRTIKQIFDALAEADIDAELVEVFDEDNCIWIRVTDVETNQNDDGE